MTNNAKPYSQEEIEGWRVQTHFDHIDRWLATVDARDAEIAAKDELIAKLVAEKPPQGLPERKDAEIQRLREALKVAVVRLKLALGIMVALERADSGEAKVVREVHTMVSATLAAKP